MVGDDNLTAVLVNVAADARPATRDKIANSPETREFLEIGLMLLRDDLLDHRGPDLQDDHDSGTCLFAGLSQSRLIERAEREGLRDARPKLLTVGMFRDRWRYKSRFTEDLISYLFRPAIIDDYMRDLHRTASKLSKGAPYPELIRQLADAVLAMTVNDPLWSMQNIIWVALPNHPRIQSFLRTGYDRWITQWAAIYEELAGVYDLRLRPGYTWLDVAELFDAVASGTRVRARSRGSLAYLSNGDNVLVGAIQAMLPQLFVNAADGLRD
ncbi:hypothetical protein [Paractinoplanes maris]|uniref:hypothetical protein n=1 Tax=Paractinoplanes maris TaxID=1734446 RepID=UPI0020222BBE|nr:hypothetical protein [Actinoplanes maris]